jgi:Zn-dependent alcohol dehydrogenase
MAKSIRTRTAVLRAVKDSITVEHLTLQPPRTGEVVVKIETAGVCKPH